MEPDARPPEEALPEPTVPAAAYDERYFLSSCAGHPEWVESGGGAAAGRYAGSLELARLEPGETLVDIGTGRGELLAVAVGRGAARAVGVEYSPAAIALARRTLAAQGADERAELIEADARAIPLPDAIADVVTLLDVVEHLAPEELARILGEAHRLLRPGGRLLVHTLPNRSIYVLTYRLQRQLMPSRRRRWPHDPRRQVERDLHVNEQSVRSLRRALRRAGFRRPRVRPGAGIYTDFVPAERARGLYRRLASLPLLDRLGAADIWAQAVKGRSPIDAALPAPPRRRASLRRAPGRALRRARRSAGGVPRPLARGGWRGPLPGLGRLRPAVGRRRPRPRPPRSGPPPTRSGPPPTRSGRAAEDRLHGDGPLLVVRGHSLALGAGLRDDARERFTRLVADELGMHEASFAVGGAITHWSTYGDVGDGGYSAVLQGALDGGAAEGDPPPASAVGVPPGSAAQLPPGSAALLFYGINDLAVLGARMRPYREALRTVLSRVRAKALFEAEHGAGLELSPGWHRVTGAEDRGSGSGHLRAERPGATAAIALPEDFLGGTVAIGFVVEPGSRAVMRLAADSGPEPAGHLLEELELDGDELCSSGRANGVVWRLTALPPETRSIRLETTEVAGGVLLDYWQIEADPSPPVLLLEHYRLVDYDLYRGWPADPVTDADLLETLNPATRAVAAEFDEAVLLVDTDGALGKDYAVARGSYPDASGHRRLAEHVLAQVRSVPALRGR